MQPNTYPGKFITLEGVDASGKSRQFLLLKGFIQAALSLVGRDVLFTKEPDTDHESGREIYDILMGRHKTINIADLHPFEMQSRYFRNRIWHYRKKVLQALMRGEHVISDRGVASICFGISSPDEFRPLLSIEEQAFLGAETPFPWPDMILIFDVPVEIARERLNAQGKDLDAFERDLAFQMRVGENYLEFARRYPNCHVIDGSGNPDEVFQKTKEFICPFLGLKT